MPAKFVFDLEPVLQLRERVEEEHQRRVAAIERERVALEQKIRDMQREIDAARARIRDALVPGSPVGEQERPAGLGASIAGVRQEAAAMTHMTAVAQRSALELAGVLARLERARAALLKAATDRKAVELLKKKRHEAWRRELDRKEQSQVDEINVMRAARARQDSEAVP